MDLALTGKKILITGASQGIGEGLAAAFAAEGGTLYLTARSGDKLAQVAADLIARYGIAAHVLALDMTAVGAIDRIVEFAGDADVLVNNAGAIQGGDLWEIDEAKWRAGWELKLYGYINLTRVIYTRMKQRGAGVILNNIGNGGENFDFNYVAGTTGNAALMAFTRALGGKSIQDGIRVVGVNPGPVETDRIRNILRKRADGRLGDGERYTELLADYPLGRAANVCEIADMFVFLASERSSYTSGTIITIDGGITSNRAIG